MLVFISLDWWFLQLYCWHQRKEGLSPSEQQSLFQQYTIRYLLPRLSKYLPFFSCESKIPVHTFSLLLAQISETTEN